MKKIFIVFILLSFTFGINANTKKKIIEDCNYLEQILTQAYVNYDEAASKGFNIDLLTKNIKLNYKKNRQTLHKYETGTLNIPYEIFFDIASIFNISSDVIKDIPMTREEEEIFEKKMIKNY